MNAPTTLRLPAPAKLNLFLHILGRRPDGYHQLQTVFQLLDRCDYLSFRLRTDNQCRLDTHHPTLNTPDNLILQAARALQAYNHTAQGIDISLEKHLPIGGGLGGGSSNAATTLIALNHCWQLGLSIETLCRIGLPLGADVPVFILGQSAWAEGIGEQLTPLTLAPNYFLVINPPCHVTTSHIFSHRELTRNTSAITVATFLERGGKNDCQAVVAAKYPAVSEALAALSRYASPQLTGTGSCVFAAFDALSSAEQALRAIKKTLASDYHCFIAKGINHSPLHTSIGMDHYCNEQ